jgi:integrase
MLTDTAIRALKPRETAYKAFDALGLYLLIQPTGSRLWRFKYRHAGKEGVESLGAYPDVSLALARQKRDELRRLRANGVDLAAHRRAAKAAEANATSNSLKFIADEWFEKKSPVLAPKHAIKIIERLRRDVYPWLGSRPISEVSPSEILAVLRRIEQRGAIETAYRALGDLSAIFRYAVATVRASSDPCRDLRGALSPRVKKHFPAITDPKVIPDLLARIDGYPGTHVVRAALRLAPLVFVRPGELRTAKWADIDLDVGEWRFTASKTKQPHLVPLSIQAVAILRELQPLTGRREYLFPGERSPLRPMSENTVNAALRSLDVPKEQMSGHGFRAMARTILDEVLKFPAHLIEAQLAHAVRDANGRAYNRTTHLEERRVMMQRWADYLDVLRSPKVVPFDGRVSRGGA